MSEFTVMVLRFALFAALWIFVFVVAGVLRQDLFGPRQVRRRGARKARRAARRDPAPAAVGAGHSQAAPPPAGGSPGEQEAQAARELVVTSGPLTGTEVALGEAIITLGRSSENTLVLSDDFASGHHARIYPEFGLVTSWYVEDLGSTNGTFVGGNRLTAPMQLPVYTPVTIGNTTVELRP